MNENEISWDESNILMISMSFLFYYSGMVPIGSSMNDLDLAGRSG